MLRNFIFLTFCLFLSVQTASAIWPFSKNREVIRMPVDEQESLASYHMEEGLAAEEKGQYRKALGHYKKIRRNYPASTHAAESLYRTGKIRLEQAKYKKAFDAFQTVLVYYPNYEGFNDVIEGQFEISVSLMEGKRKRFLLFWANKNYERSAVYFEGVVRNAPFSDYAPQALMHIAHMNAERKKYAAAIDAYDRIINHYPNSVLTEDAYLELANTFSSLVDGPQYDQASTREAINYYRDFLILYPESANIAESEERLAEMREIYARSKLIKGEFYFKRRNNYRAAKIFFNEAITDYPESVSASSAREYLAVIEERGEDYRVPRRSLLATLAFWKKDQAGVEPTTEVAVDDTESGISQEPRERGEEDVSTLERTVATFTYERKSPLTQYPSENDGNNSSNDSEVTEDNAENSGN